MPRNASPQSRPSFAALPAVASPQHLRPSGRLLAKATGLRGWSRAALPGGRACYGTRPYHPPHRPLPFPVGLAPLEPCRVRIGRDDAGTERLRFVATFSLVGLTPGDRNAQRLRDVLD